MSPGGRADGEVSEAHASLMGVGVLTSAVAAPRELHMPPRRAVDSGLGNDQLTKLAEQVAAGRRPRVRVSGGQFPEGTSGTVLRVGDPAADGDDYVLVRVKVHGVTDELRFSPKELSVGRARAAAPEPAPAKKAPPTRKARPARRAAPAGKALVASTRSAPAAAKAAPADKGAPREQPASAAPPSGRPARRSAPAPTVTITVTSSGSSWSVAARRGAKTVVKKADVTPGAVAAIAALLGDPAVEDAVAAVNDSARAVAEARAEQLRAELAAVEAVLVSHERP